MRDAWLDTLRATAISAVVVYHVVAMSPEPLAIAEWTRFGALGVDLFFVLSGWLIGKLYWRERVEHGRVQLLRFWQRRWWRTLPAYYAALALSWLAVFVSRREPFDWRYLVFLQNYRDEMPYFLVSWSLCIEEHFYLLLPLLLLPASRWLSRAALFVGMIAVAPLARLYATRDGISPAFGYEQTGTHLRMEGLLLGFSLSAIAVYAPAMLVRLRSIGCYAALPLTGVAAWFLVGTGKLTGYVAGSTLVAFALAAWLIAGVGVISPERSAARTLIQALALISYSIYLTHALTIHAARELVMRYRLDSVLYLALAPISVLMAGVLFYRFVEKPSLQLRERFAPRIGSQARETAASPAAE
jgi:peptidoglycan/LPS O-acetylase OafA/YrhL